MKTRSAAFDHVWNDRTKTRVWRVELLRRYWNGSAYVLEAAPIVLPEGDVVDISAITRRVDDRGALRVSNVTIKLKNHDQEWLPSNTVTGRWAPSAAAALGFDPINSEVRIYAGYVLDDGTEEMLPMFTGVIDDEPQFDTTSGTASFTCIALAESKLKNANAQKVCVEISDASTTPTAGNGTNLVFGSGLKSLWDVKNVREAGAARIQGDEEDYKLEDLNDAEIPARIEFNAGQAPANGAAILFDGRQWHRDVSPAQAIALLCDEAGIAEADRVIEEPIFDGVDQSQDIPADVWTTEGTLISGGSFESAGDVAAWSPSGSGTFSSASDGSDPDGSAQLYLYTSGGSGTTLSVKAQLIPGSGTTIEKTFNPRAVDPDTGTYRRYIIPGSEGPYTVRFIFYWNGVEYGRVTSPETVDALAVEFYLYGGFAMGLPEFPHARFFLDYVRGINTVESPELDLLAAPNSWLPLTIGDSTIQSTCDISTKVASSPGGTYDAAVLVDGTMMPTSALKRYAKIVIEALEVAIVTPGTIARLNWRSDQLFIKSLDLTGFENCLDAAAEIADFTGMDQGSTDDGKYFFRNRVVSGAPDMVLDQKNAVIDITNHSLGLRDVRNKIQVRYGKSGDRGYYFTEYGATEAGDTPPTSEQRFGERVREIVMDRFLFSNNANVTVAIASKAYAADHIPRRSGKAPCRFIPQLENRDRVALSFHISPLIEEQIMGDPLQTAPALGGASNTLLRDVPVRIAGKTDNVMQGTTNLDWEEILR